jgi:hypothetical protein
MLFFVLRYLEHQMHRLVVHCKIFHQHCLYGGNQVFIRRGQALELSYDNIFIFHGYLQTSELIRKRLNLGGVVQQLFTFLHLERKEHAANEENIGIIFYLMNVRKGFLCSFMSFATVDVRKLVDCQIKADDRYCPLHASLVLLQHFGISIVLIKVSQIHPQYSKCRNPR